MFGFGKKTTLPNASEALLGRTEVVAPADVVAGNPVKGPFPEALEQCLLGMACFWGAYTTAVGYASGLTSNPNYDEVCTGASCVLAPQSADELIGARS